MLKVIQEALTFDDVLLVPNHSNILPSDACLKTQLTSKIQLNINFNKLIEGKIKIGGSLTIKDREFGTDNYQIAYRGLSSRIGGNPNNILNPDFIYDLSSNIGHM